MIIKAMDVAIGFVVTGGLTVIVLLIKALFRLIKSYTTAIKALSHDAFFRYCRYLDGQDELTESEHENLEHLYNGYHSLGLNGSGDKLYNQVCKKPIKANEE